MNETFNRTNWRNCLLLLLWGSWTALTSFMYIKGWWLSAVVTTFIWLESLRRLCLLFDKSNRKTTFLLDAIENADYNFKYRTEGVSSDEAQTNRALNRIIEILTKAKLDAQQREKYYELILDSVNTGIIVIDPKGFVYQHNKEALHLLGMKVFTHIAQLKQLDEKLYETFLTIKNGTKTNVSFRKGNDTVALSIHASATMLREKPVRIIALNDIKSELDEKEIDSWIRLTRVLTHEIMNSITPVTSLSEILLQRIKPEDEELKKGLETIRATGSGLLLFVENYRKFTHIAKPVPALFYVKPFAERMKQLSLHQMETNAKIQLSIVPDNLILYADENLTSHVVLNLLKNAIQAINSTGQHDGLITFKAYCTPDESIIIKISNNGPLIPKEEEEHIFVPFFTTKPDGSGIGLAISRQIMHLNGGSLTLQSAPEQHLTTFIMRFP